MAGTVTHLAIADKIYLILGDNLIKNLPLFFGGSIAPDAIHAKKDYQRADKKHSHLCDGIRSYGYGYPETAQLFKDRVNSFIENYYLTAGEDKDLYLGYVVHLLTDELYLHSICYLLEEKLINSGAYHEEPEFRKKLADEIINGGHSEFFNDEAYINDISARKYSFSQNVADILGAVWDYEVKDYISADEINRSKRWVINKFVTDTTQNDVTNHDLNRITAFIDFASDEIIAKLSGKNDIFRII